MCVAVEASEMPSKRMRRLAVPLKSRTEKPEVVKGQYHRNPTPDDHRYQRHCKRVEMLHVNDVGADRVKVVEKRTLHIVVVETKPYLWPRQEEPPYGDASTLLLRINSAVRRITRRKDKRLNSGPCERVC
jgi:hypothetical protein